MIQTNGIIWMECRPVDHLYWSCFNDSSVNFLLVKSCTLHLREHLLLIKPSSSNAKLEQTCKLQRNFDKATFKNDLHKMIWKEHCSNPGSNVALEHILQIINKLLDKHTPYVMSKSRSSCTSKSWITTAIANSIKSKNKIYKKKL